MGLIGYARVSTREQDTALQLTLPLESVSHNRAHELACLG